MEGMINMVQNIDINMIHYIDINDFATNGYDAIFNNFARRYKKELKDIYIMVMSNIKMASFSEIVHSVYDTFIMKHPKINVNCEIVYTAIAGVIMNCKSPAEMIRCRMAQRIMLNDAIGKLIKVGYFAKNNLDLDGILGYYDHYALYDFMSKQVERYNNPN